MDYYVLTFGDGSEEKRYVGFKYNGEIPVLVDLDKAKIYTDIEEAKRISKAINGYFKQKNTWDFLSVVRLEIHFGKVVFQPSFDN